MKAIKINTTSASTPVVFACTIKVKKLQTFFTLTIALIGWMYYSVILFTLCVCFFHGFLNLLTCTGLVDGGLFVSDIKFPCRTHPHWLEPTIYQSEAPPERSSTPSECIGLEARSMLSVAVKISSQNAERNVKVFHSLMN